MEEYMIQINCFIYQYLPMHVLVHIQDKTWCQYSASHCQQGFQKKSMFLIIWGLTQKSFLQIQGPCVGAKGCRIFKVFQVCSKSRPGGTRCGGGRQDHVCCQLPLVGAHNCGLPCHQWIGLVTVVTEDLYQFSLLVVSQMWSQRTQRTEGSSMLVCSQETHSGHIAPSEHCPLTIISAESLHQICFIIVQQYTVGKDSHQFALVGLLVW